MIRLPYKVLDDQAGTIASFLAMEDALTYAKTRSVSFDHPMTVTDRSGEVAAFCKGKAQVERRANQSR